MVCRSFFAMSSPHSAIGHVSLAITSCDIVIAHHVRVMVVVVAMVVVMRRMVMVEMMAVAVIMIARLVMLNVVKHLYQVNIPPLSTD